MRRSPKTTFAATATLLLVVGGCAKKQSVPPQAGQKSAIIATEQAPGSAFTMSLTLDPAQPKFASRTKFRVKVKQPAGQAVTNAEVRASLVMPLMDMGKNEFALKPEGNGEYEGTGEFNMAGEWEVAVTAKAEGKSGKTTFNVNVVE